MNGYALTATRGELEGFLAGRVWKDLLADLEAQLDEIHRAMEDKELAEKDFRFLQGAAESVRKQMELPMNMLAQLLEPRVEREDGFKDE